MRNPYSPSSPATGFGFFNRTSLLDQVVSTFVSFNPPEPFLIIGDRRSGKTSILKTIANELTQKQNKAMGKIVLPVYVDLELFTPKTEMAFYLACIRSLAEVLAPDSRNLIDLFYSFSHSGDSPIFGFIKIIRETVTRSQSTRRIERIAILVDEFDAHLKWIDPVGFLELTQHIRAALMDETIPLAMVLAGSTKAYVVTAFGGSPLYAITRHRVLEPFEWEDALALMLELRKGSELEYSFSKDDLWLIWELTGGHPFLIQRMMHHICELLIKRAGNRVKELVKSDGGDFLASEHQLFVAIREDTVTESDLRSAQSSLAEDFKKWYDKMEEPVRRVYQQIAVSVPGQGISLRSLRLLNFEAVEDSYLEERLTTLRSIGIIREINSLDQSKCYVISGQAFRMWFFSQTGAFERI